MKTDTTLFEIYSDLGIDVLMQSDDVQEFVIEELQNAWNESHKTNVAAKKISAA